MICGCWPGISCTSPQAGTGAAAREEPVLLSVEQGARSASWQMFRSQHHFLASLSSWQWSQRDREPEAGTGRGSRKPAMASCWRWPGGGLGGGNIWRGVPPCTLCSGTPASPSLLWRSDHLQSARRSLPVTHTYSYGQSLLSCSKIALAKEMLPSGRCHQVAVHEDPRPCHCRCWSWHFVLRATVCSTLRTGNLLSSCNSSIFTWGVFNSSMPLKQRRSEASNISDEPYEQEKR